MSFEVVTPFSLPKDTLSIPSDFYYEAGSPLSLPLNNLIVCSLLSFHSPYIMPCFAPGNSDPDLDLCWVTSAQLLSPHPCGPAVLTLTRTTIDPRWVDPFVVNGARTPLFFCRYPFFPFSYCPRIGLVLECAYISDF